jgi:hypothetical protein
MDIFENHELGKTKDEIPISTAAHHRDAALRMVRQARNTIEIISRALDPPVYDEPDFVEAAKKLVLNNRRARIRILVCDPLAVVRQGHRLLQLAGQLSSFFDLRKPGPEHIDFNGSILVADSMGCIVRNSAERYEGTVHFHNPRLAKNLLEQFSEMWDKSEPDPNLRRMLL